MRKYIEFFKKVFSTYGVMIFILIGLNMIVADEAKEISTLFQDGNLTVSIESLIQYFALALLICLANELFLTEKIIKKGSSTFRTACLLISIGLITALFIVLFGWLPIDDGVAWGLFLVCFIFSSMVSVAITKIQETTENNDMEKALKKFKENRRTADHD